MHAPTRATAADMHLVRHTRLQVLTTRPVEIIDLTESIRAQVTGLGLRDGLLGISTRHTTTGIVINECEPLLLSDLMATLERAAPAALAYAHDDLSRRTVNLTPAERRNGHAHCRAALLGASELLPVQDGELQLGRWQRVLFVECDGGQRREVSLTFVGLSLGSSGACGVVERSCYG